MGPAGLYQPAHLGAQVASGLFHVGDHLVAGLRARVHLGHFRDDVADAAVDDQQVVGADANAGLELTGGQELVDLLRHRRRGAVAGRIGLGIDAGVAGGK